MADKPIPYQGPHQYHDSEYVQSWAADANTKRPHRQRVFDAFVSELRPLVRVRVLEVGCGPGFLAERILEACDVAAYTLFDFSEHMIGLAQARLAPFSALTRFVNGSFLDEDWHKSFDGDFDAIVSLQAVHETREQELVPKLYREIRTLLNRDGRLIVGDLTSDSGVTKPHLLSAEAHHAAMSAAGFSVSKTILEVEDLVVVMGRP